MKIYYPQAKAILDIVSETLLQKSSTDTLLFQFFRSNKKMGKRDRLVISECCYGIIRSWEDICQEIGEATMGWDHLGCFLQREGWELPQIKEHTFRVFENLGKNKFSISEELKKRLESQKDDFLYEELEEALNQRAPVFLKLHRKTNREDVFNSLKEQGIEVKETSLTSALQIPPNHGADLKKWRLNFETEYPVEIQDMSCQQAMELFPDLTGLSVWEVCAGNGGKSIAILEKMGPGSKLLVSDIAGRKLEELQRRIREWGFSPVEEKVLQSDIESNLISKKFNVVYLDVPCSGSGTWRRSPWLKLWDENRMPQQVEIQAEMLKHYSQAVEEDGCLIYSTCSIWKDENQGQIAQFIKQNPAFHVETEQSWQIGEEGGDGFYLAILRKSSKS